MRKFRLLFLAAASLFLVLITIHFPYATDSAPSDVEIAATIAYYQRAYAAPAASPDPNEYIYVKVAQDTARAAHVKENLQEFVNKYDLVARKRWRLVRGKVTCKTSSKITRRWTFHPRRTGSFTNNLFLAP